MGWPAGSPLEFVGRPHRKTGKLLPDGFPAGNPLELAGQPHRETEKLLPDGLHLVIFVKSIHRIHIFLLLDGLHLDIQA